MTSQAKGTNWPILLVGLAGTVFLLLVLASGFGKDPRVVSDGLVGKMAPDFSLDTLEGQSISLTDVHGNPAVINFWATWCEPCKTEYPALVSAALNYKPRGVVFLGVLYNDDLDAGRRFASTRGSAFPTLYDSTQRISVDYGVSGVPETYVLDRDGRIHDKIIGPVSPGELESILEELL